MKAQPNKIWKWDVAITPTHNLGGTGLWVGRYQEGGPYQLAKEVTFEFQEESPGMVWPAPTFFFPRWDKDVLIKELHSATSQFLGLSSHDKMRGEIEKMGNHLEDMRALSFQALQIKQPKETT
ncbi:MAG: hypothetical protein GY833_16415 [Aestuariibacter sp.]|nr:hypothetical protein [Aestuariibacter sp.]